LKKQGAKIQEAFDCEVLNLKWRKIKAGEPVETEIVRDEGNSYIRGHPDLTALRDWYPPLSPNSHRTLPGWSVSGLTAGGTRSSGASIHSH